MTELNSIRRKLYIGLNQSLYLGVMPVPHREHDIVADKLIVSLQGDILITLANGDKITSRTCLAKAGIDFLKCNINTNNAVMAIYFLEPLTQDYSALESIMPCAMKGLHYDHPETEVLVQTLLKLREASTEPEQAFLMLRKFIVQPQLEHHIFKEFDERIVEVVHQIRITVRDNLSLKKFADEVSLSESRLVKLFKSQMGIPITKYRLRYRVLIGIIHLSLGHSITEAALAAGFASAAHFSKSFSAINGIPPSETFFKPPHLEVLISDRVLKALSKVKICQMQTKIKSR